MEVKKIDSVDDELPSVEGIGQRTGLCTLCSGICNIILCMHVANERVVLREALSYEMCMTKLDRLGCHD